MNPDLDRLQPYPFQRLAELTAPLHPPRELPHIALSMGEPRHPTPALISEALLTHLHGLSSYPLTRGSTALREACAAWTTHRFHLPDPGLDPQRQVLPVNGTREALFAFAQAVVDRSREALVVMPNPFYQIYEGAALLAGAEPWFANCRPQTGNLPDLEAVPDAVWARCQLLYLCTPGNPTGAVFSEAQLQGLIERAERHGFIIASDECYSEIYAREDQPPPGLLGAAARMGNTDYRRCVSFHSLSKRSNAPGLRSGFVAGDGAVLEAFLRYRIYHGCAMAPPAQAASIAAWGDESHVTENRRLYRDKFRAVIQALSPWLELEAPAGGFYLWPRLPVDDEVFARRLYAEQNVSVLPGSYLSRTAHGVNPGAGHVRMALVAPLDECLEAAERMGRLLDALLV